MLILGLIIWTGRPLYLLFLVALMRVQIYRSQKESEVLGAKFGAEYTEYRRRTWF